MSLDLGAWWRCGHVTRPQLQLVNGSRHMVLCVCGVPGGGEVELLAPSYNW